MDNRQFTSNLVHSGPFGSIQVHKEQRSLDQKEHYAEAAITGGCSKSNEGTTLDSPTLFLGDELGE